MGHDGRHCITSKMSISEVNYCMILFHVFVYIFSSGTLNSKNVNSAFSHRYVVPNLYDFISSVAHRYFFLNIIWCSVVFQWSPKQKKHFSVCVSQKKVMQVWNDIKVI